MVGKVNSIIRLRVNSDGEGVRSVIFMQNCPLSCVWCCNPETRYGDRYKEVSTEQLYDLICRDRIYFDASNGGITFSGGEPLSQASFIVEFLTEYGHLFNCNIETSLFSSFDTLEKLIPYINEWYIDFKVYDEERHLAYTKVSNEIIKRNLGQLAQIIDTEKIIVTYPIITGYNDSIEDVDNMISFMKKNGIHRIELHPYRKSREKKNARLGLSCESIDLVSPVVIARIKKQLSQQGIEIVSRDIRVERGKCEFLKCIRRDFCLANNVSLSIEECSYKGRCVGTCPKCEEELDYINQWRKENHA